MKKIAALAAVAGVVAVMFAPVQASAESAELRITGTIVPSACKPAFAGGGVVDYGVMSAGSLNQLAQTTLADKSIQLTLTCEASALFAFKVIDERAGTAVASLETIPTYGADSKFGLGAVDGKNIGAYSLQITKETADNGPTQHIHSADGGASWSSFAGGLTVDGSKIVAFADTGTGIVPGAHSSVTADIRVVTAIDRGSNLPLTQRIALDGLSTFEVVYL
ncbi:hypothetical protein CY658_17970 [Variovorax sp. RO1]|uniref:DUF1120 domain-containing protein n=1 Tax=Variovorax sp. RO1 TaxID=2066034 RepID=UPI000C7179A4|nr:DUF1120 domain-containing protein [Variovorax sp. RO1]PLC03930.1 hypothetical protein CY658_17970 [Variovorax sp. RO1]